MTSSHISKQSLQWTRPLLDELFEEVRQAIERFGDEDRERQEHDLDEAIDACEKVAGSLAVMEFKSGQLIAEAMGMALEALKSGDASDEDETISRVLEATAILPDYLDYLESAQSDSPVVVLPTINDLRSSAGQPALDEASFFRPDVDQVELPESKNDASPSELRRDYQHALRGFLINNQDAEAIETLATVALKIRDSAHAPSALRRIGWAVAALCEAMSEQHVTGGPNITRLLARTDVTLKAFADQTNRQSKDAADDPALTDKANDLCRSLLFQIALSQAETPLASDVHEAFNLADHVPDQLARAKVFLAGRNRSLFAAVTKAAREDLARIKEALGTQLEQDNDPEVMAQQTALLESVGESLAMLGLDHLSNRVKGQASKLSELGNEFDDPALLRVARELLVVESQLEESFGLASDGADQDGADDGGDATLLPPSEQRRVVKQLVKEALEDLAHAKHLLDAINRGKADDGALDEAVTILDRIAGALQMANLPDAAMMLGAASRVAVDHLSPDRDERDPVALEALAETLTTTEFYLESLTLRDERGRRYLDSARQHLSALGYIDGDDSASVETDANEQADEAADLSLGEQLDDQHDDEFDHEFDEALGEQPDLAETTSEEIEAEGDPIAADGDDLSIDTDDFEPATETGEPADADEERTDLEFELDELTAEDDTSGATEQVTADTTPTADDGGSGFDDFDIVEIFIEEFDQELASLQDIVPEWQDHPGDEERTRTLRRSFHSLKGSGRMAGATEIGEFAWQIEGMLNHVLDGQLEANPSVTSIVADAVAALPSLRARLTGQGEAELDEASCQRIAARAEAVTEGRSEAELDSGQTTDEHAASRAALPPELEGLDDTLIELMIKELSENLEALEHWLHDSQESGHTPEIDEGMVRIVHTMKGTMRLAPIGDETETAQILEAYLEELSLTHSAPSSAGMEAMAHCAELFRHRLHRLQGETVDSEVFNTAAVAAELRDLHSQAHRDRTGEQAPVSAEQASDEPALTSDVEPADSEDTIDFFEIDDEELAADGDGLEAEAAEADATDTDAEIEDLEEIDEVELEDSESAAPVLEDTDATTADLAEADEADEADEALSEIDEGDASELEETDEVAEATDDLALDEEAIEEEAVLDVEDEDERDEDVMDVAEPESQTDADESLPEWERQALAAQEAAESEQDDEAVASDHHLHEADESSAQDEEATPATEPVEEQDANLIAVDYSELNEDLLEAFLEEGQELLEHSDGVLQQWRENPDDKSLVTALQRDLHTIKGSSRMVGLNPIGQVAHVMEELLEGIAAGLKDTTRERIDALEAGCDHLNLMIDAVTQRQAMPMRSIDELFADQAEEFADEFEEAVELPQFTAETPTDRKEAAEETVARGENLRVPSSLVDELVNYAGEISIFRSRLEQQISVFRNNVGEVDETVIRLRDQLRKLELETEAQILARYEREHGPAEEEFDPLELDRYSTIQQLSRGLAESVNDLTSLTGILDDATRQSETLLMQQSRVNTELQEGLMQARMVSFNTLLPRFRRVVRNAAREVGKKAQLDVELAGEGELDRNVLERITAPIEHLLRNAISHGIETPDDRLAAGKPATGTIRVDVSREATELVMRISDDGAGLNLDKIKARAIERGLIDDDDVDESTLTQMIFHSGFSTAEQVSELSGRGIGMDVVANEVRQIGGSVSAQSNPGQGALFTIRIPLSLTVMQAIMVRAADRQFAIPLQSVRGVTRILAQEWSRAIEDPEPAQQYAGESYPLLELEPQLDFPSEEQSTGTLSLLMVEAGDERAALRVSDLLGHREIVIKPVGPQISSIVGILGGTITGDGQVVPILDIGPLIRRAFAEDILPGRGDILEAEEAEEVKRTPLVMVVDDSITMRRVTARVLENRGLEVVTARDGLDAVEALFDRVPDLMLLDIEMPRMDGYELATHVRNDPRLKDVPMMMITSRSGEKHRQRAREIGVNDYLAKPYQEAELVQHVFDLLNMAPTEG
jgi:chemosensory pili system protein ChpA (sensor histidine kinase/response regulator)